MRALKFSASAPIVVSASTPMRMPLIVRKLRSLWRATLRMISIGGSDENTALAAKRRQGFDAGFGGQPLRHLRRHLPINGEDSLRRSDSFTSPLAGEVRGREA